MTLTILVTVAAGAQLIPFECRWVGVLAMVDVLRKAFKLNAEAIGLIIGELDFLIPFVMNCGAAGFASASFGFDPGAIAVLLTYVSLYTVNIMFADADLAARNIEKQKGTFVKYVNILLGTLIYFVPLVFGVFQHHAENQVYSFKLLQNEGAVESISMCARFISTPLLFNFKFIVKSLVYKGRTVIIKMPLIRHVMPKRGLRDFLRRRAEGRVVSSLSKPGVVAD